jgi:hypothetical protein
MHARQIGGVPRAGGEDHDIGQSLHRALHAGDELGDIGVLVKL